ncbi:NAD-dependent epimerase/dehydratase family protein [Micromonospora yasonensis]|uniref:NAD-dependent epimerase/dehydratase family protein n=1 Tax=Micromonospora yasonensis TaxID=1128667 RepID=UPI0022316B7A|nr:NAD-dependent epimerase/dehydratase family protein [Micromonospora yasonensis]MCW3839600.1 NAD-dependent epimerase/dehydratase family protein [Micromonospora yasonensis]
MKIVVTGGAGFIGSNVVRAFTGVPGIEELVVLDDLSTGSTDNLAAVDAHVIEGSILEPALLDRAFRDATSVIHLAAVPSVPRSIKNPLRSHHANATGTLLVLEAARRHRVGQVIVASSSSVYGRNPTLPKHESLRPVPLSPYAVSKLATESYAIAYASCFDLAVLPFRFFNVFGPGQSAHHAYAAVVPSFVSAAIEGRPLMIDGDGEQTRDFTFVGDVAAVIVDAVLRQVSSMDPVNLAFGSRTSLRRLVAELEDIFGRRLEVEHRPPRAGDVRDSQADNSALRALFPGVSRHSLRQGLEATVAWMSARVPAGR